jgi:hypothetical protein
MAAAVHSCCKLVHLCLLMRVRQACIPWTEYTPCCHLPGYTWLQTDPKQLGTTKIPQRLLPSSWHHTDASSTSGSSSSSGSGLRARLLGQQQHAEPCYTLSLAPGPLHHFLSHVPDEGARKQVGASSWCRTLSTQVSGR